MHDVAKAFRPEDHSKNALSLCKKFRPEIPEGVTDWGAKGTLDTDRIRSLASEKLRTPGPVVFRFDASITNAISPLQSAYDPND
jgi:hypothetical protein